MGDKMSSMNFNGPKEAAKILASLPKEDRDRILVGIARENPELARQINQLIFSIRDLLQLSSADLGLILNQVSRSTLCLAMRGVEEEVLEHLLQALSKRAQQDLREEIQALGPQPKAKVEAAQQELLLLMEKLQGDPN